MDDVGPADELPVPAALAGERVDRAVALLTGWSRGDVQDLVARGEVLVDGARVAKSHRLEEGAVIALLGEPTAPGFPEPDAAVDVVVRYEDDDVLVVAKPAGVVVHPGTGHAGATLVNGLLARHPELRDVGDPERPGIVHRLDRDTSGLLVVARSAAAYDELVVALARHEVERDYLALVWGHLDAPRGVVDAPIGRSPRHPTRMAVRDAGRPARTRYTVRDMFDDPALSLLECSLETGRTHQIRVHLQAIGHPVVGDPVYGGARPVRRAGVADEIPLARPFLHASRLAFTHPTRGDVIRVEEPLPPELTTVLARLG